LQESFVEIYQGRVIPTRMATKKRPPKTFTVNEAAKQLGVTRAAIHQAIKEGRLDSEWGEAIHIIKKKARLITAEALKNYQVDLSHQDRGKKT
jgi:hypothetical protein